MLLGVRIKELRKERGFTQAELAQKVSVSKSSISYYVVIMKVGKRPLLFILCVCLLML